MVDGRVLPVHRALTRVTEEMVEAARNEIAPYRCYVKAVRDLCADASADCKCRDIARAALEAALAVAPKDDPPDEEGGMPSAMEHRERPT